MATPTFKPNDGDQRESIMVGWLVGWLVGADRKSVPRVHCLASLGKAS